MSRVQAFYRLAFNGLFSYVTDDNKYLYWCGANTNSCVNRVHFKGCFVCESACVF